MPIKPENRKHYTKAAGWPAIRAAVLKRAQDINGHPCCELCSAPNGWRILRGRAHAAGWEPDLPDSGDGTVVVLTIAHINQDPTDNRMTNLLALCQRCHNRIDLPYRQRNAAATREKRHRIIPQNYSDQAGQGVEK